MLLDSKNVVIRKKHKNPTICVKNVPCIDLDKLYRDITINAIRIKVGIDHLITNLEMLLDTYKTGGCSKEDYTILKNRYIKELTLANAAENMNLSVSTYSYRLHRALKRFREWMIDFVADNYLAMTILNSDLPKSNYVISRIFKKVISGEINMMVFMSDGFRSDVKNPFKEVFKIAKLKKSAEITDDDISLLGSMYNKFKNNMRYANSPIRHAMLISADNENEATLMIDCIRLYKGAKF